MSCSISSLLLGPALPLDQRHSPLRSIPSVTRMAPCRPPHRKRTDSHSMFVRMSLEMIRVQRSLASSCGFVKKGLVFKLGKTIIVRTSMCFGCLSMYAELEGWFIISVDSKGLRLRFLGLALIDGLVK